MNRLYGHFRGPPSDDYSLEDRGSCIVFTQDPEREVPLYPS